MPGPLALLQWMLWPTETFDNGFRDYGDLFTLKNPLYGTEVVVSHPELIKQIFTGDPDVFHGGEASAPIRPVVGSRSVLLLDGREHHRERKLLLPPFHGERLAIYADVMRGIASRVIDAWPLQKPFSLLPSMQRITFDAILETVFGVHDEAEQAPLRDSIVALLNRAQSPLGMVWLLPALQRDLGPLTGWAAIKRLIQASDEALYALIARARATASDASTRTDILSMLLAAVDEQGEPMSDEELRDELMTMLLAGHETTAMALGWAVEEIARRPEVLGRILEELRAAPPDQAHRGPLPYLDATIKEVLRLHPVAPLLTRRLTAPISLRGYEIPAGMYLIPCVYLAHRHPDYWDEPAAFRPERFLNKHKKPDPYAWIPFGGGTRRCVGMAFALLEMRVVLATLLPRVRLRLPDKPAKVSLRGFLFAPSGGPRVIVEERSPE